MELTVGDLLEFLQGLHPESPVRMAHQPSWPFEYAICEPVVVDTEEGEVVYLPEGTQTGYLPAVAGVALGWIR